MLIEGGWTHRGATPTARQVRGTATAVVNAVAHIDVKATWLSKERLVADGAAAIAVAGGVVLGIRLRFQHHTPQQAAVYLAFHQQEADELGGNDLRWAGKEGLGEGLGKRGEYRSGLGGGSRSTFELKLPHK